MSDPVDPSLNLEASLELQYTYQRSVGAVLGRALAGLQRGVILGARTSDGRVLVPPLEYDPLTGQSTTDLVEVPPHGVVTTWTWADSPHPNQPLETGFAWALVRLDGADTGLLHAVDVPGPEHMKTGMRVSARWRDDRRGHITDIACFVPERSD